MTRFTQTQGDMLTADAQALINAVNTVGVMGKGLALQFKSAFPANFVAYKKACALGRVELGKMFVSDRGDAAAPRWIINFPTKSHWRQPSSLEDIAEGLNDLRRIIRELRIQSVAVPALGCGLGGLSYNDVLPIIKARLAGLETTVLLYTPNPDS